MSAPAPASSLTHVSTPDASPSAQSIPVRPGLSRKGSQTVNAAAVRPAARKLAKELLKREVDLDKACAALDPLIRRKPAFWVDREVRRAALILHGEVYQYEALAIIAERYGAARAPSKSALDRLWQKLPAAKKAGWRLW